MKPHIYTSKTSIISWLLAWNFCFSAWANTPNPAPSTSLIHLKTLQEVWECETKSKLACVSIDTLRAVQNTHTLLIPGFLNELAFTGWPVGYYKSNLKAIRDDLKGTASFFGPPSNKSVQQNAWPIYKTILRLHHEFKKPLVLIGHSKGGAEILYLLLQRPELILSGIVDRAILIQAAIGGTPLVHAAKSSRTLSWLRDFFGNNIDSLSPEQAKIEFEEAANQLKRFLESHYPDPEERTLAFRLISDRIFYVRSAVSPSHRSASTQLILHLLNTDLDPLGPNDGVLLTEHQRLSWIGRDLDQIFTLDHIDFTIDFSQTMGDRQKVNSALRRSFTRSLLEGAHSTGPSEMGLPWNESPENEPTDLTYSMG